MTHLTEAAGRVIASDITTVFHMTDNTLLISARLVSSVLEGTSQSGIHPRTKQKLLETMSSGFAKLLESRKEMVQAHGQMVVIQRESNIAEIGFGCWGSPASPAKIFTTGRTANEPSAVDASREACA